MVCELIVFKCDFIFFGVYWFRGKWVPSFQIGNLRRQNFYG